MSAFERSMIRLTRVNIGVVAATGLFICLQWCEMKSGGRDTSALAEQAKRQTAVMSQQMGATAALAIEAKIQAEATGKTAATSEKSLRVFEAQQRAWVALAFNPALNQNHNGVEWYLHNWGNSPAFRITAKGEIVAQVADIAAAQTRICREIENDTSELLFPSGNGRIRSAFSVGAPIVRVAGCIRYQDRFSKARWTKFCYEPDARRPEVFDACFGFNSTDADRAE